MEHYHDKISNTNNWFNYCQLYKEMVELAPNNAHFVEIGSWEGRSSVFMAVEIINSNKKIQFDCVDNFYYDILEYRVSNIGTYMSFLKNIYPVKDIIRHIKLLSVEAVNFYGDETLDFVFIDAGHDYESVNTDITLWYPKVKNGGYIGGHDFSDAWPGVIRAVHENFAKEDIKIYKPSCGEIGCNSWLYKK